MKAVVQVYTGHHRMQVDSKTGVITTSYEPAAGGGGQQQAVACTNCQQQAGPSHRAGIVGAAAGAGLVLLLLVAGGDLSSDPLMLCARTCINPAVRAVTAIASEGWC